MSEQTANALRHWMHVISARLQCLTKDDDMNEQISEATRELNDALVVETDNP